jgi:hypothetical protein
MGKCVADFVCLSLTVQENIKRMVRDELENALRAGPRTAAMTAFFAGTRPAPKRVNPRRNSIAGRALEPIVIRGDGGTWP